MNKILLVDDNADLLLLTALSLKRKNFEVKAIAKWEEILLSLAGVPTRHR